ncbi:MAG: glycosyltransferase, partial [Ktedonobacterales bacterium]
LWQATADRRSIEPLIADLSPDPALRATPAPCAPRALLASRLAQAFPAREGEPEKRTAAADDEASEHQELTWRVWPRVSVIVPARDEERNIRGCVESLLAQDYPNMEVIVVDDASTDATPRILDEIASEPAAQGRLSIVRIDALPNGWAGKPHALHTGVQHADGDWLLFTDADTRHTPTALRAAVERAEADGADLFTIATNQELSDFWSQTLLPIAFMGVSMQYPLRKVNDPRSSVAIANGQYLLIRRWLYDRVGGYASPRLRATLVDDRDLAYEAKRAHGRLEMVESRGLGTTRMYHTLREQWAGWGKNAYIGSKGGALVFPALIVGLPLVSTAPFALTLLGLLLRRPGLTLAGAAPVAAILAYRSYLNAGLGLPQRAIWTHPLGAAVFTAILARSYWRGLRGQSVPWRGRSYSI